MTARPQRWLRFAAGFAVAHFAFWTLLAVRDLAFSADNGTHDVDMGLLGAMVITLFLGPLTALMFTIGYAVFDSVVAAKMQSPPVLRGYDSIVAGLLAFALLWGGLSFRNVALSNNLVDTYLGGGLRLTIPWGSIMLGGLSGALTSLIAGLVCKYRVSRRFERAGGR